VSQTTLTRGRNRELRLFWQNIATLQRSRSLPTKADNSRPFRAFFGGIEFLQQVATGADHPSHLSGMAIELVSGPKKFTLLCERPTVERPNLIGLVNGGR